MLNRSQDNRARNLTSASIMGLMLGLMCASPASAQDAGRTAPQTSEAEPVDDATAQDIIVTGQFVDTGATSATKMDITVLDTPFSVSSYNGNFLKAIETVNVADLYRYMTGVQKAGDTGYDITLRGFKAAASDRNAILTDGLPGLSVRFGSPPTVGTDHIELVKGPTSVLYGQGQPGGFINIITKKPSTTERFEIGVRGQAGLGTYDRALGGLVSLDLTGPIDANGVVSARFVGEGGYTRGFRDFTYQKPIYAAPSIRFAFGRTEITLMGEYRWVKAQQDNALIAPNRDVSRVAAINTIYQEKDDFLMERGAIGSVYVDHRFSDKVKLNVAYRYVDHFDTQVFRDTIGFRDAANTIVTRRARHQENTRTYSFVDANLNARVSTFGLEHRFLIGFNGGTETADFNRRRFFNCTGSTCNSLDVALYNPAHGNATAVESFPLVNPATPNNLFWRLTVQKSLGVYASDLVTVTDWLKLMGGVRYADERQTISDRRLTTVVPVTKADKKWLPLGGVLVQPTDNLTVYASYSSSYVPVAATAQDVFGLNPFNPTEANSREVGVKTELFGKRLNITSAYFDIRKKNTLNTFACPTQAQLNADIAAGRVTPPPGAQRDGSGQYVVAGGNCSNQLGGERSRGFEVEVSASPLPNWSITTGYSHANATVSSSNVAGQTGARLPNAPRDAFNLWTRYDFEDGMLDGLGAGLGVSYIGKRAGLLPTQLGDTRPENGTMPLPAYTTVDLGLYYKLGANMDLTMRAANIFDRRYIESASNEFQVMPGSPRQITLALRTRF